MAMSQGMPSTITAVIVEDDPFSLDSIKLLLASEGGRDKPGIRVVATADTVELGVRAIRSHAPTVTIVDLMIAGNERAGIRLAQEIVDIGVRTAIMLLTALNPDGIALRDAFNAGVRGFYRKQLMHGASFQDLIRKLASGERVVEEDLLNQYLDMLTAPVAKPINTIPAFSPRERDMLRYINQGYTARQISQELGVAEPTVKATLSNARQKLGKTMNSQQLALFAAMKGLLEDPASNDTREDG